jgi:hypothetical protein
MASAPAPSVRPVLAHWRATRRALEKLMELYADDPETAAILTPFSAIAELIDLLDALLQKFGTLTED